MVVVEAQETKVPAHHLTGSQLTISAGNRPLLQGLDFHVTTGEIIGLWGVSGCGKSTLLRSIAGLQPLLKGSIELDTQIPDAIGWPTYRQMVRYIMQRPAFSSETVEHHLTHMFSFDSVTMTYGEARSTALSLMARAGLSTDQLHEKASNLSEGEQQRFNLIRGLLTEPCFLLLDEPTSSLDPESAEAVEAIILDGAARDQWGGLWVSHDRVQLERVCDRVIELAHFCLGGNT